jgi:hypothetical protein
MSQKLWVVRVKHAQSYLAQPRYDVVIDCLDGACPVAAIEAPYLSKVVARC